MTDKGLMTTLTTQEAEPIQRMADAEGVSFDEMATKLFADELKRRIKDSTGHAPARVYKMPTKGNA